MSGFSFVGALGDAFGGYAQDRQRELQQQMMARQMAGQDFSNQLAAMNAGYRPVPVGTTPSGPTLNVPGQDSPFAFDFDSSPAGRQLAKQRDEDAAKSAREAAAAKAKEERDAARAAAKAAADADALDQDNQGAFGELQAEFPNAAALKGGYRKNINYTEALRDARDLRKAKIAADAANAETWSTLGNPDSEGYVVQVSNHGEARRVPVKMGAKPGAGGNGLTQGPMNAARANLDAAKSTMDEFEKKLKANPELYTPEMATLAAAASSPTAQTAKGLMEKADSYVANHAIAKLQQDYPDLWKYITAKKYVAEAILNTHRRPNQTQYEIEQELSGVGPRPNPSQIEMAADRRNRMYNEVFGAAPSAPPETPPSRAGGAGPAAAPVDRVAQSVAAIRSGKATLGDIATSTTLTPQEKAAVVQAMRKP